MSTHRHITSILASAAAAFLNLAPAPAAHAQQSSGFTGARPDGAAVVLTWRVPFGDDRGKGASALSLNLGPTWRAERDSPLQPSRQGMSSMVELGFRSDWEGIFRVGALNFADPAILHAKEVPGAREADSSWVWWVLGGVVVVGLLATVETTSEAKERCRDNGNGTQTCYYYYYY